MPLKKILLLAVALHLYGCAATPLQPYPQARELLPEGQTLWTARIGRGNSPLFAGLLLLNKTGPDLEAVLLDATGIKLLAEKVLASGEVTVVSALPPVRNKRLGPFLGTGLHRLFSDPGGPAGQACRRDGLLELCFGTDESGHLRKFRRLGPFVLWSGDYFINNHEISSARLNSGWLTPYLHLERSGGGPAADRGPQRVNERQGEWR
jgi:hypothetical protein